MTEELSLILINAENKNKERRFLRNQRARMQTTVNLTDGLLPYMISNGNQNHLDVSNVELPNSSEHLMEFNQSIDHDFDFISLDHYDENNNEDVLEQDQTFVDGSEIILKELFSPKPTSNSVQLHFYTDISTNEFC